MDDDDLLEEEELSEGEIEEDEDEEDEDEDKSEDENEFESEISVESKSSKRVKRITPSVLSKYERAAVIAKRANEIRKGAQPYIYLDPTKRWIKEDDIVKMELYEGILPYIITRVLSNGTKEEWRVNELEIPK